MRVSPTMPTISSHGPSAPTKLMRFPIGLSPAQCVRASDSLITTTGGAPARSRGVNVRPAISGMPIAAKYSGVTMCRFLGSSRPLGLRAGRPSSAKLNVISNPLAGGSDVPPTRATPGIAATRSISRV